MKTVNVLLSSYNGEKYIKELILSVLNQEGVNVILTIRDDGSTDNTLRIIRDINDKRIKIISGNQNLGPAKSFLTILNNCQIADYYAFCDQDDVWYPLKLITAINKLDNENIKPSLFMSTYDVVDDNLNFIEKRNMEFNNPFRIETTLMYRCPSGCVMVFNNSLRDLLIQNIPKQLRMHDFWTLLVAIGIRATILTDDISLLKYRIHSSNTVGLSQGFFDRIKRFKKSILYNKHERSLQAKSLYDCYHRIFDKDVNEMLLKVINYRKNISGRFSLAFDRRFRENGNDKYVNYLFVLSVLLGLF